ncbi:hypothetical protein AgCh_006695 [Apium graveolens]
MSIGAAGDGLFRGMYDGCIPGHDTGVQNRPYHRNCGCALHKTRSDCSHSLPTSKVSYPIRRVWSKAITASCLARNGEIGRMNCDKNLVSLYGEDHDQQRHPSHPSSAPRTNDYDSKVPTPKPYPWAINSPKIAQEDKEPHDIYTSTTVKDPGTASKEQPRHQELSFGARRRGSPSLGLVVVDTFETIARPGKHTSGRPYASIQVRELDHSQAQDPGADRETLQEAKGKKNQKDQGNKKETEAAKQKRLKEMREQIRKEEEAKLELKIQRRMQLEEEKLLAKSRTKRTRRDPTPEFISDDDEEKQKDLKDMIYELQRKMDKDSGMEIGKTVTPFSHSLEAIPR